MISLIDLFVKEMNLEAVATRKVLAAVPESKFDWQPHPKSMTLKALATHIAELPTWVSIALTTDELDFATSAHQPAAVNTTQDLLEIFEKSLAEGRSHLIPENEKKLDQPWTLRSGETIFSSNTKAETIRHTFNQITHHRAQLGVYLRLLDVPVPGTYGPTADDPGF